MATVAQMPLDSGPTDRRRRIVAIVGASSGNLVEWYDFYAYALTSIYFAPAFFPASDPTSQLLATAGIFAVGFFMRPLGGWLFGWIADRHGRRNSMVISVLLMCAGSLMHRKEAGSLVELLHHKRALLLVLAFTMGGSLYF